MKKDDEKSNLSEEDLEDSEKSMGESIDEKTSDISASEQGESALENATEDTHEESVELSSQSNSDPEIKASDDASANSDNSNSEISIDNQDEHQENIADSTEDETSALSFSEQENLEISTNSGSEKSKNDIVAKIENEPKINLKKEEENSSKEGDKNLSHSDFSTNPDSTTQSRSESSSEDNLKNAKADHEGIDESDASSPGDVDKVEERHLDYSNYTKKQIVQVLESLLKEDDFSRVGEILKEIKKPYDEIAKLERKKAFEKYLADGGEKDGFEYRSDEFDQRFQKAYTNLKDRKNQYFNSLEKQKERNLNLKLEILEKIRELVDAEETGVSIKSLKELQVQWKEVGVISSSQVKGLWANYNALLDRFYDQRSIYFELKELDRKKNYDLKIELCEKAEQLDGKENIRETIKQLNELHEEFKHVGPVPNEDQEVVWERFKTASDKIYSKRKVYYDNLKDEQKLNVIAKEVLVEKVKTFAEFTSDGISDWNSKTKEIIAIQKEWESVGSLLKEKAININRQFWTSFKSFFHRKGQFFKKIEEERKGNLKLKQELVLKAESLKDSDDFRKTSDELKQLQKQWKEIGPVPEKNRNEVFVKFKNACDHFFDRRRENSGKIEKDYEDNLHKKQFLCEELDKMIEIKNINIDRVREIETEWSEIGFVPKSDIKSIQKRYMDTISKLVDKIDISESEKHKLRFSAQFNKTNYGIGAEKFIQKKEGALRRQIANLENDLNLWKNNIDFFASSKNADKLKEEFREKIDKANDQLNNLKEELKVISNL